MRLLKWIIICLPSIAFAQYEVTGVVSDGSETIAFANVYLTDNNGDNAKGIITDENGSFAIDVPEGTYLVNLSYLGFETWIKEVDINDNLSLGTIIMVENSEQLDEVVIVSKKKIFERKVDRIVFNVENSISVAGGDAMDALKVAPGLFVKNDEIAMIGKSGMRVMINGRMSPLSGPDLVNFLGTISSEDIKKIEIITNPPAKYEAAGNSGIVNIVFKKGMVDSWNNSTNFSYTQATFPVFGLRNTFSYQKDKVQVLFNVSGAKGTELEQEDFEVNYSNSDWIANAERKHSEDYFSTRFNVEYDLSDKVTVGALYLLNYNEPGFEDTNTNRIFGRPSGTVDSLLVNNGFNDKRSTTHSVNTHLIYKLDTLDRELSIDLDYLNYDSSQDRSFLTESFTPDNQFLNTILSADNFADQGIENLGVKVDMEHPGKTINLSYGGKVSFIRNNSAISFFNTETGVPVIDPTQTDDFEYSEDIQALYLSAVRNFGSKWKAKVGLRYETTQTTGFSELTGENNENDYNSLFPTAYISFDANDNDSFYVNYGKRINRPGYFDLNPFRFFYDSNFFSEGNPFLQPSFTHNFELGYDRGNFSTNLFYSRENDGFGVVVVADNEANTRVVTRRNYYDGESYGLISTYNYDGLDWLESSTSIYLLNNDAKLNDPTIETVLRGGFRFVATTNNSFVLNSEETLKAQFGIFYSSPYEENLYKYSSSFGLDVAFRYSMFDNKLKTSLIFNDIFNSSAERWEWEIDGVQQNYIQFRSFRNVRLSLTYSFGNKDKKVRDRGFGNEDERDRL